MPGPGAAEGRAVGAEDQMAWSRDPPAPWSHSTTGPGPRRRIPCNKTRCSGRDRAGPARPADRCPQQDHGPVQHQVGLTARQIDHRMANPPRTTSAPAGSARAACRGVLPDQGERRVARVEDRDRAVPDRQVRAGAAEERRLPRRVPHVDNQVDPLERDVLAFEEQERPSCCRAVSGLDRSTWRIGRYPRRARIRRDSPEIRTSSNGSGPWSARSTVPPTTDPGRYGGSASVDPSVLGDPSDDDQGRFDVVGRWLLAHSGRWTDGNPTAGRIFADVAGDRVVVLWLVPRRFRCRVRRGLVGPVRFARAALLRTRAMRRPAVGPTRDDRPARSSVDGRDRGSPRSATLVACRIRRPFRNW